MSATRLRMERDGRAGCARRALRLDSRRLTPSRSRRTRKEPRDEKRPAAAPFARALHPARSLTKADTSPSTSSSMPIPRSGASNSAGSCSLPLHTGPICLHAASSRSRPGILDAARARRVDPDSAVEPPPRIQSVSEGRARLASRVFCHLDCGNVRARRPERARHARHGERGRCVGALDRSVPAGPGGVRRPAVLRSGRPLAAVAFARGEDRSRRVRRRGRSLRARDARVSLRVRTTRRRVRPARTSSSLPRRPRR